MSESKLRAARKAENLRFSTLLSVDPRYLPASRFWTMRLIAGGLYLVIAATALGTAVWLPHRRTT